MTATLDRPVIDQHVVVVVGDRFEGFAQQAAVMTVSMLLRHLKTDLARTDPPSTVYVAGQGISQYEWCMLRELARATPNTEAISFGDLGYHQVCGMAHAHKNRESNVLVADLAQSADDFYTATLRIHNDNELLLDHQTGQHVQGMVAVEAARQMFLAVTERFIVDWSDRCYFVINDMNTTFSSFLFPLGATIEFRVRNRTGQLADRIAMTADIAIMQGGRETSTTQTSFTIFESAKLAPIELRKAVAATVATASSAAALHDGGVSLMMA